MTYCVAMDVKGGLIFVSDSRTNAGVDQINTYSKMHRFRCEDGQRFFVMLSSGNLATTQGVVTTIERQIREGTRPNLYTMDDMDRAAEYVGQISIEEQQKHHQARSDQEFHPEATFILGGQIRGGDTRISQIYPEGNFIHSSESMPFLQIGEVKYGKPILDRIIHRDVPLASALKCGLVSMDSTIRSNATVGPPIEYLVYRDSAYKESAYIKLDEDDEYLQNLRQAWSHNIRSAFDSLPNAPGFQDDVLNVRRLTP